MDPTELIEITDHAAKMSDRWLFLATIIVFLLTLGFAMRWLVNYFTARQDKLEAEIVELRKEHVSYVKEEGAKTSTLLNRCVEALEKLNP